MPTSKRQQRHVVLCAGICRIAFVKTEGEEERSG